MRSETRASENCDTRTVGSQAENPARVFTVLIADGVKDSSGEIIYNNRGTTILFEKSIPLITDNNPKNTIGRVRLFEDGYTVKAEVLDILPQVESIKGKLFPSICGQVIKKNGAFLEVISITAISLGYDKNADERILNLNDQITQWINSGKSSESEPLARKM